MGLVFATEKLMGLVLPREKLMGLFLPRKKVKALFFPRKKLKGLFSPGKKLKGLFFPRKKLKDLAGPGLGLEPGLEAEDLAVRVPDRWAIGLRSGLLGWVGVPKLKNKLKFVFSRNGPKPAKYPLNPAFVGLAHEEQP